MQIGLLVDNFLVIPYEKAAKNPHGFIDFISQYFHLEKNKDFQAINTYKDEKKKEFEKTKYAPFKENEFRFINENIDWNAENLIGYFKSEEIQNINSRN